MASLTASHGSPAQAHLPKNVHRGEAATESRETGTVAPQKDAPRAKPLAHFIAGGYVGSLARIRSPKFFANSFVLSESVE